MAESITSRTLHGLKWSYVSTFITALLQICYTAVMARLLNPTDFGLVAMAGVVLSFGSYFAQMGMGSAIIQKKDVTREQTTAAFTSSVVLGVLFFVLTFLVAPSLKYVFDNQGVIPLIRVMGLSFLFNGFSLTSLALIRKRLQFKTLAIAEIISYFFGYIIIGIASALIGFGVWSLVFASLTQSVVIATIAFVITKHELALSFSWAHYEPLISFGSRVTAISFLEFIGSSLDTILIGRYFGSSTLGIYNNAQSLVKVPLQYFTYSFSRVLFPSFTQIQNDDERIRTNLFLILQTVSIVIFPLAILAVVVSREIVGILLGPKWLEAAVLLKYLAFAAAVNLLTHFIAVVFEARGLLKQKFIIQGCFISILAVSFYFALQIGVTAFAIALLICQISRCCHYLFYYVQEFNIRIRDMSRLFISPSLTSLVVLIPTLLFHHFITKWEIPDYAIVLLTLFLFVSIFMLMLFSKWNFHIKNALLNRYASMNEQRHMPLH